MDQWYFYADGKRLGPISREELIELLETGTLTRETQVWARGMEKWTPAWEVEGLISDTTATVLRSGIPVDIELQQGMGYIPSGEQARPWVRYWAKNLDMILFFLSLGMLIAFIMPNFDQIPDLLYSLMILILYCLLEPVLLATWGTTPGRALLKVRLRTRDGQKPSYISGLTRSLLVMVKGMGLGLPILSLITQIFAYHRLKQEGVTSWDESGEFSVSHQSIGGVRIAIYVLILVLIALFFTWSMSIPEY